MYVPLLLAGGSLLAFVSGSRASRADPALCSLLARSAVHGHDAKFCSCGCRTPLFCLLRLCCRCKPRLPYQPEHSYGVQHAAACVQRIQRLTATMQCIEMQQCRCSLRRGLQVPPSVSFSLDASSGTTCGARTQAMIRVALQHTEPITIMLLRVLGALMLSDAFAKLVLKVSSLQA